MDLFQETALSGSQFKPPALPEVSDYGVVGDVFKLMND